MTKERKDNIAVVSACIMLGFGIILTAIGFIIDPTGEIHDSVLWVLGQSLIYAGGVFGLAVYTHHLVERKVDEWKREMRETTPENEELPNDETNS